MAQTLTEIMQQNDQRKIIRMQKAGKRFFIKLTQDKFRSYIQALGTRSLRNRGKMFDFEFQESHKNVYNLLYWYINGNQDKFRQLLPDQKVTIEGKEFILQSDVMKGICFCGPVGSGKTILMETFLGIFENEIMEEPFLRIEAQEWGDVIKKKGKAHFKYRPLNINDLFKEDDVVKDFGSTINPAYDTLSLRGETGAWTFATSNNKFESFHKRYGEYISSRMLEMFNFIEVPGPNLRK